MSEKKSGWSIGKAWKVARRRGKQKLFEAAGTADAITDSEWERLWSEFNQDVASLKKLHKQLIGIAPIWRRFASSINDAANGVKEYVTPTECPADLHKSACAVADSYEKLARHTWPNIDESFETTVILPIANILTNRVPDFKAKEAARRGFAIDLSSYKRKLQKLESNEKSDPERIKIVKSKLDRCLSDYENLDRDTKSGLREFHAQRFEMIRRPLEFAMLSQMDLHSRTAGALKEAVSVLPEDSKSKTLKSLDQTHGSTGMRPLAEKQGWTMSVRGLVDTSLWNAKEKPPPGPGAHYEGPDDLKPMNETAALAAAPAAPAAAPAALAPVPAAPAPVPAAQDPFLDLGTATAPAPAPAPAQNPFGAPAPAASQNPFGAPAPAASSDNPFSPEDGAFPEDPPSSNPFAIAPPAAPAPFTPAQEFEPAFVPAEDSTPAMEDEPAFVPAEDSVSVPEEWVLANFDFASDDNGDLPFQKGDRILVLRKDGGWWEGQLNGKVGMFPANYTTSV